MNELRKVAVLCVHRNSEYKKLNDVEVYDVARDARTFQGGMPVVAHPPCRAWSAFCAHQAKPEPGEKELGLWCVEQVQKWGGVLEQPAHSRLWTAANLPKPGHKSQGNGWSMGVSQAWWDYDLEKGTWLYFCKVSPLVVQVPLRLRLTHGDRRREQVMSKNQRSLTTLAFARWLVGMARKAT